MRRSNRLREHGARRPFAEKRPQTWRPLLEILEGRLAPAVLRVNSLLDNTISGNGLVTLREAIIAANNDTTTDLGETGSGADTIRLDSSIPVPAVTALTQTSALPAISQGLTIEDRSDTDTNPDWEVRRDETSPNYRIYTIQS